MRWLVRTFGQAFIRKLGYMAALAFVALAVHFLKN